jgi:HEAT repeat protein
VALQFIKDSTVLEHLQRAKEDPDASVRAAAAISLDRLRTVGNVVQPLVLETVPSLPPFVMALFLDRIPKPEHIPEFIAALNDSHLSAELRQAIASKAVPTLRLSRYSVFQTLQNTTAPPTVELLKALGELGDPRAVPYLLQHAGDGETLAWRCRALADIAGEQGARGLIRLLGAPNVSPQYRARPRWVPSATLNYRVLRPILNIAADAIDADRGLAVIALSWFPGDEAVKFFELSLRSGDAGLRAYAEEALAGGEREMNAAVRFNSETDTAVRSGALCVMLAPMLSEHSPYHAIAVRVLLNALGDADPAVASAAEQLLVSAGSRAIRVLEDDLEPLPKPVLLRLRVVQAKILQRPEPAGGMYFPLLRRLDEPTADMPVLRLDDVRFSAVVPNVVAPGEAFLVDFWAHLHELNEEIVSRSRAAHGNRGLRVASRGPVKLARDTAMSVRMSIPDFGMNDLADVVIWTGKSGNTSFAVTAPPTATPGTHVASFGVFVGPLLISRLYFEIQVAAAEVSQRSPMHQCMREIRIRSAFASYATEDRNEVLARLQGMLKIIPDLDVFLDVLALRSGENWRERIREAISSYDIFYLFWSIAASRSPWVENEWRTALAMRGLDYIDPVPLQPPDVAPPPLELATLHFSDWSLVVRTPFTAAQ